MGSLDVLGGYLGCGLHGSYRSPQAALAALLLEWEVVMFRSVGVHVGIMRVGDGLSSPAGLRRGVQCGTGNARSMNRMVSPH
jgi:hypothetical protein